MGILINTGFDVGSSSPIDNRTIKNTTDERDALVSEGKVYENLKVYCKDTKKEYRWTGTEWETLSGNSSEITYDTLETTDKTIVGAINEVNGNSLDTVGFSVDYKNIILNRKNGLNPYTIPISAIINNAKLIELGDVDSTDIGNGKILAYDSATNKHKYVDSSITDELVKMGGTTDAKYLGELIDKSTVVNDNGVLKVKKLDGQEVTITEINYLKGLTMNVMDLVNAFANGGVKIINTPVATYADLLTYDKTSLIDSISYLVYVLADETHDNAKTTYLIDKTSSTPTYFGFAGEYRDFTTNPVDLASEVTGKLGTSHIDVDALWSLLTINDTYKTLTTNNEVFGTHGAKALYDELVTDIGKKANSDDLTTHTNDTDIHTSATEKASYVKKTDITTTIDETSTDDTVPTNKAVYDNAIKDKNIKTYTRLEQIGLTSGCTVEEIYSALPNDSYFECGTNTTYDNSPLYVINNLPNQNGGLLVIRKASKNVRNTIEYRTTNGNGIMTDLYIAQFKGVDLSGLSWQKVCTTKVEDVSLTKINIINGIVNPNCNYQVKNGVCYIQLNTGTYSLGENVNGLQLATGLPIPLSGQVANTYVPWASGDASKQVILFVDGVGDLRLHASVGANGCPVFTSFSYPVAES